LLAGPVGESKAPAATDLARTTGQKQDSAPPPTLTTLDDAGAVEPPAHATEVAGHPFEPGGQERRRSRLRTVGVQVSNDEPVATSSSRKEPASYSRWAPTQPPPSAGRLREQAGAPQVAQVEPEALVHPTLAKDHGTARAGARQGRGFRNQLGFPRASAQWVRPWLMTGALAARGRLWSRGHRRR